MPKRAQPGKEGRRTDKRTQRPEPPRGRVLLVDDDRTALASLVEWTEQTGHAVAAVETPEQALRTLKDEPFSVMVTELMVPSMDGLEFMDRAKALNPDLQIVILTSYGSIEGAVGAIRSGAVEYLQKPARKETFQRVLRKIHERRDLSHRMQFLQSELRHSFHTGEAIGKSHQMRHLFERCDLVAHSGTPVMIQGEPGTGKEVLARLLHARSERSDGPFVVCDLKAGNDAFLQDEVFGTDRAPSKPGKLKAADGGTVFLKEIWRLSTALQIRLLNFLQDQVLRDASGNVLARLDVHVVASSSRDLRERILTGRFREDLFYRLAVVYMEVPPLRDRKIDLLPLAEHFLKRAAAEHELDIDGFHRNALALLMEYHWPGNVTELEEAVEQAALACTERQIMFHHMPASIRKHFSGTPLDFKRSLKEVEREHILKVLEGVGWNRTRAADVLGIRRMTLYNKIREYGLSPLGPVKEK